MLLSQVKDLALFPKWRPGRSFLAKATATPFGQSSGSGLARRKARALPHGGACIVFSQRSLQGKNTIRDGWTEIGFDVAQLVDRIPKFMFIDLKNHLFPI